MTNNHSKSNRAYVLQTVVSKNGSWNSDFDHKPKQYEDQFFASDRALKYAVRDLMDKMGKEVFYKRWVKEISGGTKSEIKIMSKTELKKHILGVFNKDFASSFWEFEDIRQFGMVYDNLALHGVVQISQGLDLYRKGILYPDDGTGRMVFEKANDMKTQGMFTREHLSEAHFAYDISINPRNVKFLLELKGYEDCFYSIDDYHTLLDCLRHGPRNVKSTQKMNCFTGFMAIIELKEEELVHLGNLQGKLTILPEKEDGKVVYDIDSLLAYCKRYAHAIESIVIEYEESEIKLKEFGPVPEYLRIIKH